MYGFYTVKIKNLATKQIQRMDVLVMEHIFANTTISRVLFILFQKLLSL